MRRIAVTGARGFLAGHLLQELRRQFPHAELLGVASAFPDRPVEGVRYATRPEPVELVFHLAGGGGPAPSFEDPQGDVARHVVSLLDVVPQVAGARLVLASSCAVYGAAAGPTDEATPLQPTSPYGVSKAAAEGYLRVLAGRFGIDPRCARLANAYGPGQRRQVVHDLALRSIRGAPLRVRGHPEEQRDFLHAADVARALILIAMRGESGATYNVGSGVPTSLGTLAEIIATAAGLSDADLEFERPAGIVVPAACPATDRLRRLGFSPGIGLREGIAATVAWMRRRG